ncbi:MAG: phosphoribosylformylglycinamidine synthase subunit PurS [Leadbetterella sp.]|nr:phosphoribosylformylglycinamidine synthase subunit PurS [Leadbetterella sp.]
MKFKASIDIMPIKEILDPQGKAVLLGLKNLNIKNIDDCRIGRHIELVLEAGSEAEARESVENACKQLLANLIMEEYTFTLSEA